MENPCVGQPPNLTSTDVLVDASEQRRHDTADLHTVQRVIGALFRFDAAADDVPFDPKLLCKSQISRMGAVTRTRILRWVLARYDLDIHCEGWKSDSVVVPRDIFDSDDRKSVPVDRR